MSSSGKSLKGLLSLLVLVLIFAGCSKNFNVPVSPECGRNPAPQPTFTPTPTAIFTATCTFTFTATSTFTPKPSATRTASPTYTPTAVPTCAQITARGTHFNAFDDFSFASNPVPDGAWRYGWENSLGGPLQLYTTRATTLHSGAITPLPLSMWVMVINTDDDPDVIKNENGTDVIYGSSNYINFPGSTYLHLHPGPQNQYSVVRWTCPADGNYYVDAAFRSLRGGVPYIATTDTHVLHNNVSIYNGLINGIYSDGEIPYATTVAMRACDTLDFAVGFGSNGNYFCDSTGVRAAIDYVSALP
jgi:hypothetical protein